MTMATRLGGWSAELAWWQHLGLTALHLAASCGHVRTVQLLARHGAILNVKENHGSGPGMRS